MIHLARAGWSAKVSHFIDADPKDLYTTTLKKRLVRELYRFVLQKREIRKWLRK